MTSVGIRELRDGLSRHLEQVKSGEVLTITDHGRPIARIVPIGVTAVARRTLDELVAEGQVTLPSRTPTGPLPPPVRAKGTVSDLVAEQRR